MMRRTTGMVVAFVAALGLAACGGGTSGSGGQATVAATTTAAATTSAPPATTSAAAAASLEATKQAVAAANAAVTDGLADQKRAQPPASFNFPRTSTDTSDDAVVTDIATFATRDAGKFWIQVFRREGKGDQFGKVAWQILQKGQSIATGCEVTAGDPAENNAYDSQFYCPADRTIYFSVPRLVRQKYAPQPPTRRDFAVAIVAAHEMGHKVQDALGIKLPRGAQVKPKELQADCLAGVWAATKYLQGDMLDDTDLAEAIASRFEGGDNAIDDPQHHGTGAERVNAFNVGYRSGVGRDCTLTLGASDGSQITDLPPGNIPVTFDLTDTEAQETATTSPTTTG